MEMITLTKEDYEDMVNEIATLYRFGRKMLIIHEDRTTETAEEILNAILEQARVEG